MHNKKILIIGHGGSGKDTVSNIIANRLDLTFTSSSRFVLENIIYPKLQNFYKSAEDCFNDRRNNRELWHDLILAHNAIDKAKLIKDILYGNDIYCGLRNYEEFKAGKHLFDYVIYVDAGIRVAHDSTMQIPKKEADFVFNNNDDWDKGNHTFLKAIDKLIKKLESE
jgi:deoxyadenosine/deoxycytidine kinase